MYRILYYLIQPGVLSTGLMSTALQVGLAFANTMNVGGVADMITSYGMSGQLASGGLIAALTGAYYSLTQRKSGRTLATGAGAVAGGISGTLGTAITQSLGWTALAEGALPVLNFPAIGGTLIGLFGAGGDPSLPTGTEQMFDSTMLAQVFGSTAAGGGIGALIGRFVFGGGKPAHA